MLNSAITIRRYAIAIALLTCLTSTNAQAIEPPKTDPVDGKIKWVYDYEKGKQLSRESGKPMFVVFRCER